ncbi:hypothetical protein GCM10027418_06270 [Mariniluteicoccus endophyticus]
MSDARLTWTSDRDDRARAAAERTNVAISQLSQRYQELPQILQAVSRPDGARRPPGPRSPLRIDAQSLIIEITKTSITLVDQAAAALNVRRPHTSVRGRTDGARTLSRLLLLSSWSEHLHTTQPTTARDVSHRIWSLNVSAGRVLGLTTGAFRIDEPCPDCGLTSLWADPETLTVACGIPECAYRYSITGAITRHTTSA